MSFHQVSHACFLPYFPSQFSFLADRSILPHAEKLNALRRTIVVQRKTIEEPLGMAVQSHLVEVCGVRKVAFQISFYSPCLHLPVINSYLLPSFYYLFI